MSIFRVLFFWTVLVFNENSWCVVVAHRGASFEAPENTIASINLAWIQNADAVEIDVHLTRDGKVVAHHDKDTTRLTNKVMIIKETDSTNLRMLDVGSYKSPIYKGERIPFLEEAIDTIPPKKILVIEIKSGMNVVPAMTKIIEKSPKKPQIRFISFDYDALLQIKKNFPDNKAVYLLRRLPKYYLLKFNKINHDLIDGVSLEYSLINQQVIEKARKANLEIHAYTVNDIERARYLKKIGVDSITTDKPKEMLQNL